MTSFRRLLLPALLPLPLALTFACNKNAEPEDSNGTDGTGGTGGTGGAGQGGQGGGENVPDEPSGAVPGAENFNCDPPEGPEVTLGMTALVTGFTRPVQVTYAPGDSRLFVIEQGGVIWIVEGGARLAEPLLDLRERVHGPDDGGGGEQGLLGLAFHPDLQENGLLYVHYSASGATGFPEGDTLIAEFRMTAGSTVTADPDTERVFLHVEQPATNHNGGTVAFGPDGLFYIFLGDGGGGGDTYENGQNETTLLGSVLRIDVDDQSQGPYGLPPGNLRDVLPTAAPEIFSYGLRNPFRATFDGCTGDLYIGDVGQNTTEEVNVTLSGRGQLNYGWPIMEGTMCFSGAGCDQTDLTLPLAEYPRGDAGAVTGGSVYRGNLIPSLRGTYFFADSSQGRIWKTRLSTDGSTLSTPVEITSDIDVQTIVSLQNGPDGEIYATSLFPGTLHQLVAR